MDKSRYKEIWIETDNGRKMCALINGDLGWLMYLGSEGDSCFRSRNAEYSGDPDTMLEYYLDNGQRDIYPLSWAIPVTEVYRALEYFRNNSVPPDFINWHED